MGFGGRERDARARGPHQRRLCGGVQQSVRRQGTNTLPNTLTTIPSPVHFIFFKKKSFISAPFLTRALSWCRTLLYPIYADVRYIAQTLLASTFLFRWLLARSTRRVSCGTLRQVLASTLLKGILQRLSAWRSTRNPRCWHQAAWTGQRRSGRLSRGKSLGRLKGTLLRLSASRLTRPATGTTHYPTGI